jgi:hypothetical protein
MSSECDTLFIILDILFNILEPTLKKYEKNLIEKYPKTIKQLELKDMSLYTIHELDEEEDAFYDSDSELEFFSEYVFV